jgi:hypothetical protein
VKLELGPPPFPFSGGLRLPEPPPVFVIVSDIRDSEIPYSHSYLRGSYEIEADLTRRVQYVPQLQFLYSPTL